MTPSHPIIRRLHRLQFKVVGDPSAGRLPQTPLIRARLIERHRLIAVQAQRPEHTVDGGCDASAVRGSSDERSRRERGGEGGSKEGGEEGS